MVVDLVSGVINDFLCEEDAELLPLAQAHLEVILAVESLDYAIIFRLGLELLHQESRQIRSYRLWRLHRGLLESLLGGRPHGTVRERLPLNLLFHVHTSVADLLPLVLLCVGWN